MHALPLLLKTGCQSIETRESSDCFYERGMWCTACLTDFDRARLAVIVAITEQKMPLYQRGAFAPRRLHRHANTRRLSGAHRNQRPPKARRRNHAYRNTCRRIRHSPRSVRAIAPGDCASPRSGSRATDAGPNRCGSDINAAKLDNRSIPSTTARARWNWFGLMQQVASHTFYHAGQPSLAADERDITGAAAAMPRHSFSPAYWY